MKLLVFTQKVDKNDPILGFFHNWIIELSKKAGSVEVICLQKGEFDLPKNVTVYSLGKERGVSWLGYIQNFYHYLFLIRGSYNRVFVHMNQEYMFLGGLYWKLAGIPVYFWRNHPVGGLLTRFAVFLSTKVFCTSKDSFTARFKKTVIMPVGVNTNIFERKTEVVRKKYSVCMVSRLSPIKHVELGIAAISRLVSNGVQVSMTIIGSASEKDRKYGEFLKMQVSEQKLSSAVSFIPAVTQDTLPDIYNSHEIYLNLTPSGSFDKTIVEASSCGAIPLVSNASLKGLLPEICLTEATPEAIGASIQRLFEPHTRVAIQGDLEAFAKSQSLSALMEKLISVIA